MRHIIGDMFSLEWRLPNPDTQLSEVMLSPEASRQSWTHRTRGDLVNIKILFLTYLRRMTFFSFADIDSSLSVEVSCLFLPVFPSLLRPPKVPV